MASVGGAFELIGVRAVILDARQYIADGKRIEATNAQIAASTEKVGKASLASAAAQAKVASLQAAQIAGNARLAASIKAVQAAESDLASKKAIAASPRPQNPTTGRFISRAQAAGDVQAAEAQLAIAKSSQAQAAASIPTIKAQNAARAEAARALTIEAAATEKLTASQEKQQLISKQRRNIVTSTAAVVGVAGVAAIGVGAIKAAADFETALTKINTLTSATDAETKQLGVDILDMAKKFPQSPGDLGAAAYQVLSSGIKDVHEAIDITTVSAKDSAVGLGSVSDVASVLTSVINAYGASNISAAQASDILVAAVKEGKGEAADFAGSLGRVVGVASNLGVGFDELAATIAALTNTGLKADEATTAVLGILNQLEKSTPNAQKALAGVGLTIEGIRNSIQSKGFVATMYDLAAAFKGNTSALQPLLPEVRGLNGFVSAFIVQGQSTANVLQAIRHSAGITDEAFKKTSETFAFQAALLKNELSVALIQIGQTALPEVTKSLQELLKWVKSNEEGIKSFLTGAIKAGIDGIKLFASGLDSLANILSKTHDVIASIAGDDAAVIALGAAFAWALPGGELLKGLGLIILALGAVKEGINIGGVKVGGKQETTGTGQSAAFAKPSVEGETRQILSQEKNFIEKWSAGIAAVTPKFLQTDEFKDAQKEVARLKDLGITTVEQLDAYEQAQKDANEAVKKSNEGIKDTTIALPKLDRNVQQVAKDNGDAEKAAKKAAEALKTIAEEFKKTGEEAAQAGVGAQSFTKDLKLFGEVTPQVAKAFNLDAVSAGNVQAADAIVRAIENVNNADFEFTKTLATLAYAFQQNSDVVKLIVRDLARTALSAAQAASSAVLGSPTREVANLGVGLAQSKERQAGINQRINPQLTELQRQLKSLDKQAAAAQRQASQAQKSRQQAQKRQQQQQEQIKRQAELQAAQLAYAGKLAQAAAERQAALLQDLIDTNTKAASTLQASFLKSNEDLQGQINKAIGGGDTKQALDLVEQQKVATKAYREQNKALTANGENLTQQQKDQAKAEAERQREQGLAEASLALTQKQDEASSSASSSLDDMSSSTDDATKAIDDQKQAIQDQIDQLTAEKDVETDRTSRIQESIDVLQAHTDVLKAQNEAANKTLLTQAEQEKVIKGLTDQIAYASGLVRGATDVQGDLIQSVADSNIQFGLLQGAVRTLTDEGFRNTLINNGINPAAVRLGILQAAAYDSSEKVSSLGVAAATASSEIVQSASALASGLDSLEKKLSGVRPYDNLTEHNSTGRTKFALGGFTGATSVNATLHPFEAVIPLTKPKRAREIIAHIPPGLRGASNSTNTPASIFGDLNVTGPTLEYMRAVAHKTVDEAFGRASSRSSRSGSLLTSGISGAN